jgi:hypothetical protein
MSDPDKWYHGFIWLVLVAVVMLIVAIMAPDVRACNPPPTAAKIASLPREYPRFNRALHIHFGRSWREAAIVSWKEGTWHHWATNGQYLGTFQMGRGEREEYGHGNTLAAQVAAAARYWRVAGWSPWECKP